MLFLPPGARITRTMDLGIHIMLDSISELGTNSAMDKSQGSQSPVNPLLCHVTPLLCKLLSSKCISSLL